MSVTSNQSRLRRVWDALAMAPSIAACTPSGDVPVISTVLYTWSVMTGGDTRARRRVRPRASRGLDLALGLQHAEQLAHPADEQALLVDVHPCARGRREHHVVARLDRHRHADVLPPVEPGADRQDDPVLGRRLVRAGGHEQPGLAHAVGLEFLDDDAIEQWAKDVAHVCVSPYAWGACRCSGARAAADAFRDEQGGGGRHGG